MALSVVLVIALMQSSTEGTTVGGFAAFITAMFLIISPIKHLADINQPLQRGLTAAEMIFGLMDQPIEEDDSRKVGIKRIKKAKGAIAFKDVSFSYQQDADRQDALKHVSLSIQAGEELGSGIRKVSQGAKNVALSTKNAALATIKNTTPKFMEDIALKANQPQFGETGKKLSNILMRVAPKSESNRTATMFSLMQNPEYREILEQLNPMGEGE
jgi:hypothetical protein